MIRCFVRIHPPGIDIEVPWPDGKTIVAKGNSFAAPHIVAKPTWVAR